jgi:ATP-binding cassette, subfamily B, bacterial
MTADTMPRYGTFRVAWEMIRYRPGRFAFSFMMWTLIHSSPLAFGLLIGATFDRLSEGTDPSTSPWPVVAVFAALAVGRNGFIWVSDVVWIRHFIEQGLQLRRNLLRWLLEAPGSRVVPKSPGEAVSTFRDDVDDLLEYLENWVDLGGLLVFGVGSVIVMARIDPRLTMLVLIPVVASGFLTQAFGPVIRRRRRVMRRATEAVTGFIGETFGAVQAVTLRRAEAPVMAEFRRLNAVRREAALADTVLTELLRSINRNMATVGVAIVLLVAGDDVASGVISVGDLTIFLVYLPRLTDYMAFVGDIIVQHRRTGVAVERVRALAVDAPDTVLLDRTRVPLEAADVIEPSDVAGAEPFRSLQVTDLSYTFPDGAVALQDVSFEIAAGSFTVVTGVVGSGKSMLVRALLGLVPASGEIRWNDELVEDPAAFFVPPRSAYTGQVPRLFSDTLEDNIALGSRVTHERLREAVQLAVLDPDLERLESGLGTMVGARGVKLSGGQIQRSAAARMFATNAQLLVFDDLSSALDVHTENELWDRLFAQRPATCLVVSHRRAALSRADHVLLMSGGQIIDRGSPAELLERSDEMRRLWAANG